MSSPEVPVCATEEGCPYTVGSSCPPGWVLVRAYQKVYRCSPCIGAGAYCPRGTQLDRSTTLLSSVSLTPADLPLCPASFYCPTTASAVPCPPSFFCRWVAALPALRNVRGAAARFPSREKWLLRGGCAREVSAHSAASMRAHLHPLPDQGRWSPADASPPLLCARRAQPIQSILSRRF